MRPGLRRWLGFALGGWLALWGSLLGAAELAAELRGIPGFRLVTNTPPAPEVAFFDAAHTRLSLADFHGSVVLLNFWATWCKPCVAEMPELEQLQEALAEQGVRVLTVAAGNQMGKSPEAFFQEHDLDALTLHQDPHARLLAAFGSQRVPSTYLIDRDGRVLGGVVGAATHWAAPAAIAALEKLARAGDHRAPSR